MALTHLQKLTLRTVLLADTTVLPFGGGDAQVGTVFAAPSLGTGDAILIAERYNSLASPAYKVYRTQVPMAEIMLNGFDWTRVDNLSVGKSRIWEWMFGVTQSIDPSKANIRAGINAVWVGTAADASGDGPATLGYDSESQGLLTGNDISDIHGLAV